MAYGLWIMNDKSLLVRFLIEDPTDDLYRLPDNIADYK